MSDYESIKFGVECPNYPWEVVRDTALLAEKIGFDSFWMPDHLVATGVRRWNALHAWNALCALAVLTKRIKLATGVSDTYRHHPASLAQMAATCDVLSNGRAILGIGIGEAMNLVPFGIAYDKPVGRTIEAIRIIRRLFSEDFVDFKGKYYELEKAFLRPRPAVPISETEYRSTVPLFIAASSPRTMRVTAQYGDGWLPANLVPEEYKSNLEMIREAAKKFGRDPLSIEPAHFTYVVVAQDAETARKAMMLTGKMMLLSRPRILEKIGFQPPTYDFEMTFKLVFPRDGKSWLAKASVDKLKELRLGFRAKRIKWFSTQVAEGKLDLERLISLPTEILRKELMKIKWIGPWLAEGTLLWRVKRTDAFPIDVWSVKVFRAFFPEVRNETMDGIKEFARRRWGNYRGLAFYYLMCDREKLSKRLNIVLDEKWE